MLNDNHTRTRNIWITGWVLGLFWLALALVVSWFVQKNHPNEPWILMDTFSFFSAPTSFIIKIFILPFYDFIFYKIYRAHEQRDSLKWFLSSEFKTSMIIVGSFLHYSFISVWGLSKAYKIKIKTREAIIGSFLGMVILGFICALLGWAG